MTKKTIDDIQSEVFKNLTNLILAPQNIQIEKLEDLQLGTQVPKMAEILIGEKISGWKEIPENWKGKKLFQSRITSQVTLNLANVIKHLGTKNSAFKMMSAPETTKDYLNFLSVFFNKLYIVQTKQSLASLISEKISSVAPELQVKNFSSAFYNGLPLIGLLSKASNGTITYCDKGDSASNYNYIKESCESLKIPLVLTEECISTKPDEICMCIQSIIILKSMDDNFKTPAVSSSGNNAAEGQKKLDEKIAEYKKVLQTALDFIENEQNSINKFKRISSVSQMYSKQKYIHNFNSSVKKACYDNVYKANDAWATLERNSNRLKIPIPADLTKVDEIKQKIKALENDIKAEEAKSDEEYGSITAIDKEIKEISSLEKARAKFAQLKADGYDVDNWKECGSDSFLNILGKRIEKFEAESKDKISEYEAKLELYDKVSAQLLEKIDGMSEELDALEDLKEKMVSISYDISVKINACIEADPNVQLKISKEEIKRKTEENVGKLAQYEKSRLKYFIEKEINLIESKCGEIKDEVQKMHAEYKNTYESDLHSVAIKEHSVTFPDCSYLDKLLKNANNEEFESKKNEIKELIEKTRDDYKQVFVILDQREEESKQIEELSLKAKNNCNYLQNCDFDDSIELFEKAKDKISQAEKLKNWTDDAKGTSIDNYDENMKYAYSIINNASKLIENKFNEKFDEIKKSASKEIEDDFPDNSFKMQLSDTKNIIKDVKALQAINEKLALHHDEELQSMAMNLKKTKSDLKERIQAYPQRLYDFLKEQKQRLIEIITEKQEELANELEFDSVNIPYEKIEPDYEKCLSLYTETLNIEYLMSKYKNRIDEKVDIPDITDFTSFLDNTIISLKSTLVHHSKENAKNIKERVEKSKDPWFSKAMAFLYVNTLISREKIDNADEIKSKVETELEINEEFKVEISKKIFQSLDNFLKDDINEKKIISIQLIYLIPTIKDSFIDYLCTSVASNKKIREMIETMNNFRNSTPEIIEILQSAIEKVNSISKNQCQISMNTNFDGPVMVIDFGSYETKIGFAGQTSPMYIQRSVYSTSNREFDFGHNALNKRKLYEIKPIFERGYFIDDECVNKFYYHLISYMGLYKARPNFEMNESYVILPEVTNISRAAREKWSQIMFEKLDFKGMYSGNSSCFDVYSTGRMNGFSVEIGYNTTRFCPVYDGVALSFASSYELYGGKTIFEELLRDLTPEYPHLPDNNRGRIDVESVQKQLCFVKDFDVDKNTYEPNKAIKGTQYYEFIYVGDIRFAAPEVIFSGSSQYTDEPIHNKVIDTIKKSPIEIREALYNNIVLSGGPVQTKGMAQRIKDEVGALAPKNIDVNVVKADKYATWLGGSILGTLDQFPQMAVSHDEYNECGPGIIHRKCFNS